MSTAVDSGLTLRDLAPMMRKAARHLPRTWMYAIQAGHTGPIKLGLAKCPAERLATLQTGNHEQLHGIAAWRVFLFEEKLIHDEFAYAQIRGEWFRSVPELVDYVMLAGCDFEDWDLAQLRKDRLALCA